MNNNCRSLMLCETCIGGLAVWLSAQTGKPYTGPERIVKPPMAHIAGMHDDDLVGGAR